MADVGFEIEAVKLIASLRAAVDGQERRIRHLEKLLFGMALPRAVEPSDAWTETDMGRHPFPGCGCGTPAERARAEADEKFFERNGCKCGSDTCGCIPHMLDGAEKG